jgi:hypothetical protein
MRAWARKAAGSRCCKAQPLAAIVPMTADSNPAMMSLLFVTMITVILRLTACQRQYQIR